MRHSITLAAFAILALAGCKKEPAQPKTAAEVKAEVAKVARPEPGKYRSTMKILKVEIPAMPAQMADRMRDMFAKTGQVREFCLSKADADKGFEEFNKRSAQGACKYDRFDASGGKLDAKMTCQTGKGMTGTYEMAGEISPTASHLTIKGDQSLPGIPLGGLHMESELTTQRIGDCG